MSKLRQKRNKAEKIEKDYLSQFPPIYFIDNDLAPDQLQKDIKKAYKKTLLDIQSKKKNIDETIFFEFAKKLKKLNIDTILGQNMKEFIEWVNNNDLFINNINVPSTVKPQDYNAAMFFCANLRVRSFIKNEILNKIEINKYLPDNFVSFGLYKNGFYFRFHKIKKLKTDGGTIYQHKKNIIVDGQTFELWFSKHAIDRVIERIGDELESPIIMLGEFMSHAPFMFNGFSGNQHLLCCYMLSPIEKNHAIFNVFENFETVTMKDHKKSDILMKYLYFPFVVKDNKIICKSALLPGFQGTPEFSLKQQLIKSGYDNDDNPNVIDFKNCLKEFYRRDNEKQSVITADFMFIALMFHQSGLHQFFDGEYKSYPSIIISNNQFKND